METAAENTKLRAGEEDLTELLSRGVKDSVYPGAVLSVSVRGERKYSRAVGRRYLVPNDEPPSPMQTDTVFDVASLTQVVSTTAIFMQLVQGKRVSLNDRVARYLQGFSVNGKSAITIGQLLSHCSGLASWHAYFDELAREHVGMRRGIITTKGARDYVVNSLVRSSVRKEPGTQQVFSDLGFILLGSLVEVLTGTALDKAFQKRIAQPLGMRSTSYVDLSMIKRRGIHPVTDRIAPTENCPWRKRVLCGEVHDDNAWAMGGIAGHSGLFSCAEDLLIFGNEMLRAARGESDYFSSETVDTFWTEPTGDFVKGWRYGWEIPNAENNLIDVLSPRAVGASGFTGCSLWIEPEQELVVVFLSNRIHPSRSNKKIRQFRKDIHSLVTQVFGTN